MFDVTLVSEDEVQMSAHKLVLSASSSFFKSVFRKNPHSHPLIYLTGVTSKNLLNLLDYVYQGQVELREEQVESFLAVSSRLKIAGMVQDGADYADATNALDPDPILQTEIVADIIEETDDKEKIKKEHEGLEIDDDDTYEEETVVLDEDTHEVSVAADSSTLQPELQQEEDKLKADIIGEVKVKKTIEKKRESQKTEAEMLADFRLRPKLKKFFITDVEEADIKILELITRDEKGFYLCGVCDHKTAYKQPLKFHIESRHIEGLQFVCDICEKTFRNRNMRNHHRSKSHKQGI